MLAIEKDTREKAPASWSEAGRSSRYVIARRANGAFEPFHGEVLPVFLAEQTAWRYLVSEKFDAGWHVRETRDGELVSILMTLCKGVKNVLLDPGPGVLIDRQNFLDDCLEGAVLGRVGA